VLGYLERGQNEGLTIIGEGAVAPDAHEGGYYVAPTFLAPVPHESLLSQEEVFGPVLVATPFEDEAEAIRLANGTPFGLAAGGGARDGPGPPPPRAPPRRGRGVA